MTNTFIDAYAKPDSTGMIAHTFTAEAKAEHDSDWQEIHQQEISLVIDHRPSPVSLKQSQVILKDAPFCARTEGSVQDILDDLSDFPDFLLADIALLARKFMAVMKVDSIRVRVEGVTTNACKKLHADYTDLRLITTYAGAGTDYAPHGDADCCIERLAAGTVGLFKGKLFGNGHIPCLHRSPPIEGTGEPRLILVIDTPEK